MSYFRDFYQLMLQGSQAYARWDLEMSNNILSNRKRRNILILMLLPVLLGGIAIAAGDGGG
ncbi:MAG: hypothetical protein ACD_75C02506G0003, partial [uncultured bacterium]